MKKKAVVIATAFFISIVLKAENLNKVNLETTRKKVLAFVEKKQKNDALKVVDQAIKSESDKNILYDLQELKIKILKSFLNKEAQDQFENSVLLTFDNKKEAKKSIEQCLVSDPENLECLLQKLSINFKEKNTSESEETYKTISNLLFNTRLINVFDFYLHKEINKDQKNKNFLKKFNEKLGEDHFIYVLAELERSFLAKNFSRAKEGIEYLDKNYPDYPDLSFFKYKISIESSELKPENSADDYTVYLTKCKGLSKSIIRKYRYDLALCQRELKND